MTRKNQLRALILQEQATGLALRLYNKFTQNGENTSQEEIVSLVNRFRQIQNQNQLHTKYGAVVAFDYRYPEFRGNMNDQKFELSLRNIENYTLPQLRFLVDQFSTGENDNIEQDRVRTEVIKATHSTPELVKASYDLFWNSKVSLLIDLGDLRVYEVQNEAHSIGFGWYLKYIQTLDKRTTSHQWCTTHSLGSGNSNQYGYYRKNGGTFYYIIDDSKGDKILPDGTRELSPLNVRKWYLSALQVKPRNSMEDVILTDIHDATNPMSWQDLFRVHPRLLPHKEQLVSRPFSESELSEVSKSKQINEVAGSEYEFAIQSKARKREFILLNEPLNSTRSWMSMTEDLKKLYIETSFVNGASLTSNINKLYMKFRNSDFIKNIKGTSLEKTLDRFIRGRYNELGLKWLTKYIFFGGDDKLGASYRPSRKAIGASKTIDPETEKILVINNTNSSGTYGIYDSATGFWASINGHYFDDGYKLSKHPKETRVIVLPNDQEFAIFTYKKSDSDYFVVLTGKEHFGNVYDGYFINKPQWEENFLPFIEDFESFEDVDKAMFNDKSPENNDVDHEEETQEKPEMA